jgi:predicted hydrocarbon binding protein
MEEIIEDLEKDFKDLAQGKTPKALRRELGDMVDVRALRIIVYALQWTSVGYQSALRLAGMKIGQRLGTNSERTELSLVLEEIKNIVQGLKGGKVEVEIMPGLKNAQIKVFDSSLTSGVPHALQNFCFFEEGFIEGYLDGAISKKGALAVAGAQISVNRVTCEETRCIGLGDDFCGFLIKF